MGTIGKKFIEGYLGWESVSIMMTEELTPEEEKQADRVLDTVLYGTCGIVLLLAIYLRYVPKVLNDFFPFDALPLGMVLFCFVLAGLSGLGIFDPLEETVEEETK